MQSIFWRGKLPLPMRVLVNMNNLTAWALGNLRDTEAMRRRVKLGFEGGCSDYLRQYDELGGDHFNAIALALLKNLVIRGEKVLDVGSGTGILAFLALKQGAAKVTCVDFTAHMLDQARRKAAAMGLGEDRVAFLQVDAENLPFEDGAFDAVVSSMLLGMSPNQGKVLAEIRRVLKRGGQAAVATHGIDHYYEGNEVGFLATMRGYFREFFGYRLEFWPLDEKALRRMLEQAGFADVRTERFQRAETFEHGGRAFDFYAATSGLWWFSVLPPEKRAEAARRTRDLFLRKGVIRISTDATLGYGRKL